MNKYDQPTPEDQKATDIMGYVLGAWLGAILGILIYHYKEIILSL